MLSFCWLVLVEIDKNDELDDDEEEKDAGLDVWQGVLLLFNNFSFDSSVSLFSSDIKDWLLSSSSSSFSLSIESRI